MTTSPVRLRWHTPAVTVLVSVAAARFDLAVDDDGIGPGSGFLS